MKFWRYLDFRELQLPATFSKHAESGLIVQIKELAIKLVSANHIKKSLVFFYSFLKLARLKRVILLDREFIQDSENICFCILIICRKQDILTILQGSN